MHRFSISVCCSIFLIASFTTYSEAQLLPITEVVDGDPGTVDNFISNGMADAFDGYGAIFAFDDLDVTRHVNTLQEIRAYRILDIFRNNTEQQIETTLIYFGNLGSDSDTFVVEEGPLQSITFQDVFAPFGSPVGDFDAVIAFTTGNNPFANDFIFGDVFTNGFMLTCEVSIAPGESVGLMHYATLIKDAKDRTNDIVFADLFSDSLVDSPYTVGLTPSQVLSIDNFDVILRGDVNCDGAVNLLDIQPFVDAVTSGQFDEKADTNQDGVVNLLDVDWFVFALTS